jgi:hypothetical protein
VRTQPVRIFLWLCAIFFAVLLMFRARVIWPEHPTLLTVILSLFAISSIVMLVDTIRRGRPLRRPRGSSPLRIALIAIAVITTFLALVGLLYIISPWLFINMMRLLPTSIQEWMLMDFVLRGTGFWIFAIVSGILWYIISRKR